MEASESGPGSGAASESGPEKLTGPFRKGHDPRRGRGPKPRAEREKALEGVSLTERMARILTEEWSDSDLRRLLKDDPGTFRRLMELAGKARQAVAGSAGELVAASAEMDDGSRSAAGALERWLEARGQPPRP